MFDCFFDGGCGEFVEFGFLSEWVWECEAEFAADVFAEFLNAVEELGCFEEGVVEGECEFLHGVERKFELIG